MQWQQLPGVGGDDAPAGPIAAGTPLLVRDPAGNAVLMEVGRTRRWDASVPAPTVEEAAARQTLEWRREERRPSSGPDWQPVLTLGEALAQSDDRRTILLKLQDYAQTFFPGSTAVVFELSEDARWRPIQPLVALPPEIRISAAERLQSPGVWPAGESDASENTEVDRLCRALGVSDLVHLPLDREALFVVGGHPRGPELSPQDWNVLLGLAQRTTTALEQVAREKASLTDPVTGLPNRRQMEVVARCFVANARRGEPLALIRFGLDPVEREDAVEHLPPLPAVAELIGTTVRDSDLVVYDGRGEFLLFLPKCSSDGARRVLLRLRAQLGDVVRFSAGVAEFGPEAASLEAMLQAAGEALRGSRMRRPGSRVSEPPSTPPAL